MIKKDNKSFGIVIQARTNSTRLPNKVILDFYNGKTIIDIIIEKTLNSFGSHQIVIATTKNKSDDTIEDIGEKYGINVYRGDETNVLKRFIEASQYFGFDNIIRICADNPFIQIESIHSLIEKANNNFDYIGYTVKNSLPAIKSHLGLYPEFISSNALKKVINSTSEIKYLEHVTNYIYENPYKFNIKWICADQKVFSRDDLRLTIDTEVDFNLTKELYRAFCNLIKQDLESLLNLIDNNENYLKVMKTQIKENLK